MAVTATSMGGDSVAAASGARSDDELLTAIGLGVSSSSLLSEELGEPEDGAATQTLKRRSSLLTLASFFAYVLRFRWSWTMRAAVASSILPGGASLERGWLDELGSKRLRI